MTYLSFNCHGIAEILLKVVLNTTNQTTLSFIQVIRINKLYIYYYVRQHIDFFLLFFRSVFLLYRNFNSYAGIANDLLLVIVMKYIPVILKV